MGVASSRAVRVVYESIFCLPCCSSLACHPTLEHYEQILSQGQSSFVVVAVVAAALALTLVVVVAALYQFGWRCYIMHRLWHAGLASLVFIIPLSRA